jgi:hypothetical protein
MVSLILHSILHTNYSGDAKKGLSFPHKVWHYRIWTRVFGYPGCSVTPSFVLTGYPRSDFIAFYDIRNRKSILCRISEL